MKKIDLGQAISIIANVGVIAGIAFLALELRQNNEFAAAQAKYSLLQNRTALYVPLMLNSDNLSALLAKYESGQEMTRSEELQLNTFRQWHLNNWEWEYGEVRAGRLSESDIPVHGWRTSLLGSNPTDFGLLEHWRDNKQIFPADFVDFIDNVVLAD